MSHRIVRWVAVSPEWAWTSGNRSTNSTTVAPTGSPMGPLATPITTATATATTPATNQAGVSRLASGRSTATTAPALTRGGSRNGAR